MPSFAYEVKEELAGVRNISDCCNIAQLNGMLKVGAAVNDNRIDFLTTNAAVARKLLKLVKLVYAEAKTEVAVVRHKKFWTRNRYLIRIFLDSQTTSLFKAMQSNKFPIEECCQSAYLRGMFLVNGSVNRPEKNYHLEIFAHSNNVAIFIEKFLKKLGFPARSFQRQDRFVVYFKEVDYICEFLYIINAENAVERMEIAQNLKEVRMNVNRIINCETANLQKAIEAAQRQIRDIKIVYEQNIPISERLRETAELRLKNPEATMPELAEKLFLSTSCIKHRLQKLHNLAFPNEIKSKNRS